MENNNIGEAVLLLGCLYLILNYEIGWWGIIGIMILMGFAISTWKIVTHPKELKDLTVANIEETRMRTLLMQTQIKLYAAQTIYYLKGSKPV